MTSSERKRIRHVKRNGTLAARFTRVVDGATYTGELYSVYESRGFRTGYEPRQFFYVIASDADGTYRLEGVTKDSRRKQLEKQKAMGLQITIVRADLWAQWIA